jgi:ribonuclease HI
MLITKCNTNGAYNSVTTSCGVFRNHHVEFVVAFAEKVDFQSFLIAKLCGVMRAIELANEHNWLNLWIETDSTLAVLAFKAKFIVFWMVKYRWQNCNRGATNFILSKLKLIKLGYLYTRSNF